MFCLLLEVVYTFSEVYSVGLNLSIGIMDMGILRILLKDASSHHECIVLLETNVSMLEFGSVYVARIIMIRLYKYMYSVLSV